MMILDLRPSLIAELADRSGFRWDAGIARYRDNATGRLVSEKSILSAVEGFNDNAIRGNVGSITDRFNDGRITLAQWQQQMAREIKDGWIVNTMAGRGGKDSMTFADYGRIGGRLRFEYQQLNRFAEKIKAGELTPKQIRAYAMLYANGPRTGYFDGQTAAMRSAGYVSEQRFLGDADHCEICIDYASQGRQPIGTLPEPGTQCLGRHNCKCRKEYFKADE